jgi:preprotein translocase subunit SecD
LLWILGAIFLVPFVAGAVVGGWVIFHKPALTWHLVVEIDSKAPDREAAVTQSISVLKKRLDEYGVRYFQIAPQGNGRIVLDLPTLNDPERVKSVITTAGKLELTHVISPPSPAPVQTYATREEAIASLSTGGTIPPNRVLPYTEREELGRAPITKWVVVESPPIVDGSNLRDASALSSYGEDYEIQFSLNRAGAAKFGAWTGANINEYLGVVLNDEVKSIAYIKSQIDDRGVISGRFTKQSAEDLALVLRSGALPASIKIVDERIDR